MEKIGTIAALAALAQETRLDIFRMPVQAGSEGRAVGHIGEKLGLNSTTLSFLLPTEACRPGDVPPRGAIL